MDDAEQTEGNERRIEAHARRLHRRLPKDDGRTALDVQRDLEREDEERRVRDAAIKGERTEGGDLKRLTAWVRAGEPVRSQATGYAYAILKRRYPNAYWAAVIERDRKIYDAKHP